MTEALDFLFAVVVAALGDEKALKIKMNH